MTVWKLRMRFTTTPVAASILQHRWNSEKKVARFVPFTEMTSSNHQVKIMTANEKSVLKRHINKEMSICANCVGRKPTQAAKNGQRDKNALRYTITM